MIRVFLGGVVGGLLFFFWGYLVHEKLPFGRMGLSEVPNESAVMGSMKTQFTQPGLYFFPWVDAKPTPEDKAVWMDKYKAGPSGLLLIHPQGLNLEGWKPQGIELGSSMVCGMLAAFVLSMIGYSYVARVAVVTGFGLFAWAAIEVSYWNWYGFPKDYLIAQLVEHGGGALIAGLGIAAIVGPPSMPDMELPL